MDNSEVFDLKTGLLGLWQRFDFLTEEIQKTENQIERAKVLSEKLKNLKAEYRDIGRQIRAVTVELEEGIA